MKTRLVLCGLGLWIVAFGAQFASAQEAPPSPAASGTAAPAPAPIEAEPPIVEPPPAAAPEPAAAEPPPAAPEAAPVEPPPVEPPPVEPPPVEPPSAEPPASPETAPAVDTMDDLKELEQLESLKGAETIEEEQLKFFELHGYLRLRADLFHQLDLGVYNELRPLGDLGTADHVSNDKRSDNTIGTANMRLRLAPTINVSEDIKIMVEADLLDNVVLGTTPDTYLRGGAGGLAPGISGFSTAQVSPHAGANSDVNSIEIRRVWAEVRTPVGLLKFGRQPSHWGTGMYINDGNCLDCDYGDTVDRILFGTKLFEHVLFLGMDFVNEGVTDDSTFEYGGQDKDATQLDDVQQLVFGFARKHTDAEIEELIENDDFVMDYGFYNVVRWQSYALEQSVAGGGNVAFGNTPAGDFASRQGLRTQLIERDLKLYVGDIWLKFLWKRLHMEFEAVWVTGSIGDAAKDAAEQKALRQKGVTDNSLDIDQYGMVFQIDYKFLDDALFVGAQWGLASGDPYHGEGYDKGFGVYPYQDRQFADGKYQRTKYGPQIEDRAVNNFRFDPDYHIDMILFREIIGTVTDATYLKPTIQYNITPSIGAKLDMIFSWAMEADSTPSYYHMKFESLDDVKGGVPVERHPSRWLGMELDLEVFYKSFDGFGSKLQYGVFFPGKAFGYWDADYVDDTGARIPTWFGAPDVAQTVQWHLFVEF
ncbi:MAG: TIGR04551 family protein [Myxococcales bacterium]|nr:MAG: TIGR04551 family protein [Myxococcales bacterium]